MNALRALTILLPSLLLAACASGPDVPPPQAVLNDAGFAPPKAHIATEAEIFAVTPEMQHFIDVDFAGRGRDQDIRRALVNALYNRQQLQLEYDATFTRNAGQAFAARSGNCLALVIMTAAFAHQLNLPVRFQTVVIEDNWSRTSQLMFLSGHVNLSIGFTAMPGVGSFALADDMLTVDFMPSSDAHLTHSTVVDQSEIAAMYMNNRAAEALDGGDVDDAYWWVRAALLQNPKFLPSYNTLAVVYRHHGDAAAANATLNQLLRIEPDDEPALSNMVLVLNDEGRTEEAKAVQKHLAALQPYPPFFFFDRGVADLKQGNYREARAMFKREINRAAYYHEFHFGLALADYGLGDVDEASKEMALALENSSTRHEHDIYAAKLDWLNAHREQARLRALDNKLRPDGSLRQ